MLGLALGDERSPIFALVRGEANTGKTVAFLKLLEHLQTQKRPVFYFDFAIRDQSQFPSLVYFENYCKNLERQPKRFVLLIVIDHLTHTNVLSVGKCVVCHTLKQLFLHHRVQIVLLTKDSQILSLLYKNGIEPYVV